MHEAEPRAEDKAGAEAVQKATAVVEAGAGY